MIDLIIGPKGEESSLDVESKKRETPDLPFSGYDLVHSISCDQIGKSFGLGRVKQLFSSFYWPDLVPFSKNGDILVKPKAPQSLATNAPPSAVIHTSSPAQSASVEP